MCCDSESNSVKSCVSNSIMSLTQLNSERPRPREVTRRSRSLTCALPRSSTLALNHAMASIAVVNQHEHS